MASIFKLIIEDDEGKTTVVPLRSGDISIGRMDGNTIRLMERNISRRHARLVRDNGAVFVEDLNSFNGVKINGERIDQRLEIKEGDLVEIGDYHLALQRAEVEDDIVPDDRSPTTTHGHSMAGTVPDLRLPEEIIAEAQAAQRALGDRHTLPADQDKTTRNDASLAFAGPQPIVSPPPTHERKSSPVLPPFPAAGAGVPENPFFTPASSPSIAEGHVARTEQIKVGPSRVADVPRIVCVSTEYAGREFALNRPEIIIGRVEDNDIVIEHRSVSRNHAKILFDGRVHKIIDLESANGILVNGEEYAITDLRKGDLIELGHVRFRFVPPGIAFAPNDEEAKAMLEAGVTPPPGAPSERAEAPAPFGPIGDDEPTSAATAESALPAPEIPNLDVPHDASNAATVTDTPLSALNLGEVFEPRVHVESPTERPAQSRSATARAPLRDEDDKRATAVGPPPTRPVARTERASAAVAPSFDDDDDVRPEGQGRGKLIAAVVVVCLLIAVIGLAFTQLTGGSGGTGTAGAPPSGVHDAELEQLYQKGDYEAVRDYYRSHLQEFADPIKALERYDQAGRAVAGPGAAAGAAPTPVAAAAAVPAPPPTPAPAEPEAVEPSAPDADPGLDEAVEGDEPAEAAETEDRRGTRRRRSVRRRRPAPAPAAAPTPPPDFEKAKRYELLGRRALLGGDLVNAEASLKMCLKTAPYPPCHRQLGILYAKRDDPRRALDHYRKYVELDPSARDADEVRKFIASQGGP